MANPYGKRTFKIGDEEHAYESIDQLERQMRLQYNNVRKYKILDEESLDEVAQDVCRHAEKFLALIDQHDAWVDDINKWQKEQSAEARRQLWQDLRDLPPDPFA